MRRHVSAFAAIGLVGTTAPAQAQLPNPTPYKLSVSRTGSGSGTVSSSAGAINCGTSCANNYSPGVPVTLTARPGTGSFTGWSGDCSGTGTCNVVMKQNVNVTARFELPKVSITKVGDARSIQVVSTPSGLDCGNTCGLNFALGTTLALNSGNVPRDRFMVFTNGSAMSYDRMSFKVTDVYHDVRITSDSTLIVNVTGSNAGAVEILPRGARCSWGPGQTVSCKYQIAKGTEVTLHSDRPLNFALPGDVRRCAAVTDCRITIGWDRPTMVAVR
jgi:hypothetical protein